MLYATTPWWWAVELTHLNTCLSVCDSREKRPEWSNFSMGQRQNWKSLEKFAFPQTQDHAAILCLLQPPAIWGKVPLSSAWRPTVEKYLVAVNQGFGPAPSHLKPLVECCCFASPSLSCLGATRWGQSYEENKRSFTQTSVSNNLIRGRVSPLQPKRQPFHSLSVRKSSELINFFGTFMQLLGFCVQRWQQ